MDKSDKSVLIGKEAMRKLFVFVYLVLPDIGAFAFVRDSDKPSNVNNQDNHLQFFSIHSIHKSKRKLFSQNN
jgi:hypothetical protein